MIIQFSNFTIQDWEQLSDFTVIRDLFFQDDNTKHIQQAIDIHYMGDNKYNILYSSWLNFLNVKELVGQTIIAKDMATVQNQIDEVLLRISKLSSFI